MQQALQDTEPGIGVDRDVPAMRDLDLLPGTLVDGKYCIVRALGAGGMGVVVLAHDITLARDVAIKFVRPELLKNPELRDLFLAEARAMARVRHPNVVTVHAFGEHHASTYFVMECVEGGRTVEQWLAEQNGPPDIDEAHRILDQAFAGVEAIHAAATVHRDLKPSNLLMDSEMRISVSDLGVARILENAGPGASSTIVGSSAYMAPEAALGQEIPAEIATRRDIYALGCIAYELLTGRAPFVAPTDMSLMAKHLLEIPEPATRIREGLAPGYDSVLLRALDKDPYKRWATVGDMRRALARVRTAEGEPARILVADDDPDWREILSEALVSRFPDAQIHTFANGEEAAEAFQKEPYSVVLSDLEMPEVDGMELTSRLRALAAAAHTPIIVMTAAGGPGEWRRLSKIGADAFVVKPVDPDDIAAVILRTLKARA